MLTLLESLAYDVGIHASIRFFYIKKHALENLQQTKRFLYFSKNYSFTFPLNI